MKRHLGNPNVPLFITEGIMKGDALTSLGLCTVSLLGVYNWRGTGPHGGITALGDWESVHLKDRRTYIVYDSDVMQKSQVQNALRRLHEFLRARGADLRVIYLPYGPGATKTGVDDFIATGKTVDDLLTLATDELREMPQEQDQEGRMDAPPPRVPVPPMTLAQVEQVYAKWLGDHDLVRLRTVLAAVTANLIMGSNEPVWIMVVGGSGFGKTETIAPLSALPLVHMASSISSEGALLSATPKRDKTKGATGGLLAQIGSRGLLVLKDFTTILSMNRDARAQIIAAFREIADGRWERSVETDGGRKLVWEGKIGMVAAATAAIDNAHTVLSEMGSRFTFVRMGEDEEGTEIAKRALANVGHETQMRKELSDAYRGLLEYGQLQPAFEINDAIRDAFIAMANLSSLARSPVTRDYRGQIEHIGDREAPTRMVKVIMQIWRACGVIGMTREQAWEVIWRLSIGSIPKLRRRSLQILLEEATRPSQPPPDSAQIDFSSMGRPAGKGWLMTAEVAGRLGHPVQTVLRSLQDMAAHGLVEQLIEDEIGGDAA
jgi:Domain of unknown function (DUF3854)